MSCRHALVLQPGNNDIGHIHLPNFSQAKATEAREQMERSLRQQGLRERDNSWRPALVEDPEESGTFESVLSTLWKDVTKPVLDFLGYTKNTATKDLPHITWCVTGLLSFLPIHASGCYDQPQARLADFVISSFTPTLSALLYNSSSASRCSGILAVGQEQTAGHSRLPGAKEELNFIQSHARGLVRYTQLDNHNATSEAVLAAMEEHDWVHLACHAHQNVGDATESGFFLHDTTLSVAKIAQKSFKNKGLAFLSACQTATGDKNLAEEVVHLASGMLMAGYPSVIATMWSIEDSDAPIVADRVYGQLKDGKMNYKEAAKALHNAIRELRSRVGEKEFARWVPYIHIGV